MLKTLFCSALILSLLSFAPDTNAVSALADSRQETGLEVVALEGSVLIMGSMEVFENGLVDALGTAQINNPNVVILPQASSVKGRGLEEKLAFEAMGISDVYILEDLSAEGAEDLLQLATVVWLAQGSPKQLMQELAANNLASFLPRLHARGTILGGVGRVAGALGIGYIEGNIKPPVMTSLSVMPNRGIGLWNGFVIPCMDEDDRFIQGLTACLDQPNRPAIALNHGASVRVNGDNMSFWGPGSTVFVDARKAKKGPIEAKASIAVQDVKLHSFTEGETFAWFQ
jgi:cyanophycinase-like exopeptidase